jgi:hypothetical protein
LASHGHSHEEALRDMNRRDQERQAFCASASEADLIAKLHAIDVDEAADVAELSNPLRATSGGHGASLVL